MRKNTSGFTLVELLIVIVIIAILASITVVTYNGIQQRAKNAARIQAGNDWAQTLLNYQANTGHFPTSGITYNGTHYCLGTGFPIGGGGVARCQNVTGTDGGSPAESASSTLMSELSTNGVNSLPNATPIPTSNGMAGPYLIANSNGSLAVVIALDASYTVGSDCGGGFTSTWKASTVTVSTCAKTVGP